MRTINKISKQLNTLTQENVILSRRILNFNNSKGVIWKGTKRYAH